ncbi:Neprilysin-4 [Mortierella antarctica]|nr:Neprilysin-4 [Mortierella antarctica]
MDPNMTTPATSRTAAANDPTVLENLRKIHDLYMSCMDESQLANLGRDPLLKQVGRLLQIFPVPDSAFDSSLASPHFNPEVPVSDQATSRPLPLNKTALAHALAYFNRLGLPSMNSISVTTDLRDPSRKALLLSEGGLALPTHLYQDYMVVGMYEYTVGNMLHVIMGNSSTPTTCTNSTIIAVPTKWREIARDVVVFEAQLLQAGTAASFWKDPANIHTPLSVEELSALTPSIDWPVVLNNTLPPGITNSRPISVLSTAYQEQLEALLQSTSSRTLQNHFVWQAIWHLSSSLAPQYYRPMHDLYDIVYGVSESAGKKRWETCASIVNGHLGHMLGYYFVQNHYRGNSRAIVSDVFESLRSRFHRDLSTLPWLDHSTRMAAREKIEAMTALVGFSTDSPNVESAKSLQQYYKDYQVHPGEYFQNRMRHKAWHATRMFQGLKEAVNRKSLELPPQTMNMYYDLSTNQVQFPAGVSQPPFFHQDYPEYIIYGGIGSSMGHEITWWTNATEQAFGAKAKCIVDQYNKYTVQGPSGQMYNVSGEGTKRENIADNGGLRLAYKTWKARYDADEAKLRNFKVFDLENYTAEKLFFISYARFWCQKQQPNQLYVQTVSGTHSPDQWRTNGVLQNSPAFARTFNCSLGSPMNPKKKCELW